MPLETTLSQLDQWLFLLLNAGPGTDPVFITAFRWVSEGLLATVVLALALIAITQQRHRRDVLVALGCMLLAAIVVQLIRARFALPRPAALGLGIQWVAHGASPGMPSAHATAAFAFAAALARAPWRRASAAAFAAAALIGYSRVFLGLHLPGQVLAGALLGCALPWVAWPVPRHAGQGWRALRSLMARDRAIERWLYTEVAAAYDELKADPSKALTPDQVRADHDTDAIAEFCFSLTTFPERGTRRDDIRPGVRVTNYRKRAVIAFTVDIGAEQVFILGVFYGGQDFEAALSGFTEDERP